jgi:hypothetical protein
MYAAVKSQQILQPLNGSSSLSPGTQYGGSLTRTRSQRSTGPPDRLATLKRGSIRGIQTLLGSQSPYSNSSGSIDGRISPSPSFATSIGDVSTFRAPQCVPLADHLFSSKYTIQAPRCSLPLSDSLPIFLTRLSKRVMKMILEASIATTRFPRRLV